MTYAIGASSLIVYTAIHIGSALGESIGTDSFVGDAFTRLVPIGLLLFTVCWSRWLHRYAVLRWEAARRGALHQLRRLRDLHVSPH